MMNARNTLGAGDGYTLFGTAMGLIFALLAAALLIYDAAGEEDRLSNAPFDLVHEIVDRVD